MTIGSAVVAGVLTGMVVDVEGSAVSEEQAAIITRNAGTNRATPTRAMKQIDVGTTSSMQSLDVPPLAKVQLANQTPIVRRVTTLINIVE